MRRMLSNAQLESKVSEVAEEIVEEATEGKLLPDATSSNYGQYVQYTPGGARWNAIREGHRIGKSVSPAHPSSLGLVSDICTVLGIDTLEFNNVYNITQMSSSTGAAWISVKENTYTKVIRASLFYDDRMANAWTIQIVYAALNADNTAVEVNYAVIPLTTEELNACRIGNYSGGRGYNVYEEI